MVRYCTSRDCPRYDHPLPRDCGACPDCGATEHRLDPSVTTVDCEHCGEPNAGARGSCWACQTALSAGLRTLS